MSTEKPNNSYPASNLFDGNINSQFHCNQTGDYCDIFFKLDKAYLMDRLRLISYRSSTSGLINEFKVFLKEMNTENEWVELGDYKVESYQNEWLEVKGKPYLTDEVCLRVEDSVNGWTLINELELLIHSNLEQDIRNLFEDEECEILKDNVTYQEILALEARVIVTEDYRALVLKAKELYLNKKSPVKFNLEIDEERVINQIKITTSGKIYDAEICYVDSHGHTKKSEILNIETKETETLLTFTHLYSKDFNLSIRGDIVESEIENIRIVQLNQKDFYENQDIDVRLNKELLTAVSYCGQHGDNAPSHIFDGDYSTTFHSSNYTGYAPGTYGDLVIEMDRPYLLDRVQMRTRTSGNGRIKAYEVLYKTSKAEDWKKVFDQLTEESGDDREAKFNPVLATEICIRVKNGHGNFIVISEMDIFKYNTIEARIADLFLDKDETILKPGITLEEIEAFERELRTASYRERVANAKQLYVDKLPLKEFEIPLVEELILNRIRFKTESRISKAKLKYVDNYSVEKIIDVNCAAIGDEYVLVFEPIVAKNLVILLYGLDEINSISVNTLNKLDFCIDEDIDLRIPYEKMVCSTTHPNGGYPISNMFDGNMNSQFHCAQYTDYCDVYFKLDKEYFVDRLRLKSFRSNESGLIKKFRVLLKDLNLEETWTDLGEYVVETHEDTWLAVEGKPYLTNEVCLRIEDSINGWALINELELFIHSNLEASIDDLFTNEELVELREGVTYDEIIELQNKATTTLVYKEKIKKAKELYLQKVTKKNYKLNYEFNFILDEVVVNYKALLESKVDYKLEYISTLGEKIEIENFEVTQKDDRSISLKFEKILTNNIELIIGYIDESESWKSSYIKTIEIDQTPYYCLDDIGIDYDKALITPNSLCGIHSSLYPEQNMLDGDRDTYFRSKKMGKVEFIFEEPKVINEFWVDVNHNNGRINKAKLYYKEFEEQEWIYLRDYETDNPISGVTSLTFAPVLAKKFCIEVESSYSNIILFSEVGFKVYSLLEAKVNALFEENSLFKVLKKNITLEKIEHLKSMTKENKFLKAKLEIATMILKNSGKFPIKTYNYKSIEEDSSHYFGLTVSNNTGNMVLSHHYIQPNTDYVFILNRDIEVAVMTYTKKPGSNRTFKLSKGMNIINIPEQGHMIFRGSRKEEIEYYSLNKENGLVYRYGYTKAKDLFDKNDILNEVEEGHYSNTAYVEGKTYIGAIKFDWLKNGFKSENLSKHIEIFDEYLDFIHYLDNVHGYFKQQMPYKRLLWLGLNSDPMHAGGSFAGGYTAYSGSSGPMVPVSTYNMANSWAIGHELGHELDSNDYLMGLFGEVTNNWFAEQPRQEYMKTLRCKPHISEMSKNPEPISGLSVWYRLGFFFKMRLFYTDNSFFQKMNALMQENRAGDNQEAADNFAKFSTQILKRDMSAYYIKYGFELSEEAIAWCGQYPAPAIDLQHITWENHEEFVKEEIKLFNQKYKSVSKIK
ncbi:MAG: discoidin domain-containing protein [Cetobacterium sp.]